jgi:hypothetical protein
MTYSPSTPSPYFHSTVAPTQRQEDLLLNSHILAYESLVGTLTKQVLAQQEQLSELRTVLQSSNAPGNISDVMHNSRNSTFSPPSMDLVASPENVSKGVASQHERLLRQLEPLITESLTEHFYRAEEQIAASLADRIRRITKEHVMRSVDREIRRLMRDVVVDSCTQRATTASSRVASSRKQDRQCMSDEVDERGMGNMSSQSQDVQKKGVRRQSSASHREPGLVSKRDPRHSEQDAIMTQVQERQRLVERMGRKEIDQVGSSTSSRLSRKTPQLENERSAENRLLRKMEQLRAKLEALERRSGTPSSRQHSTRSTISRQELGDGVASYSRNNRNHHHHPSRSSSSLDSSSSSGVKESTAFASHERSVEARDESLCNVDRDVDSLLQAFHDLSRNTQ